MLYPSSTDLATWRKLTVKLASAALYSPAESTAALAALKKLEQADVPWYEQGAISDDLLNAIVATVLTAAAGARAKPTGG